MKYATLVSTLLEILAGRPQHDPVLDVIDYVSTLLEILGCVCPRRCSLSPL